MKLVCINKDLTVLNTGFDIPNLVFFRETLEVLKVYEGEIDNGHREGYMVEFIDHRNIIRPWWHWLPKICFITLSKWREQQINDILQ